ncbi:PREDICTED: DNA topoisomerase 3-beta-1-like isoform X2 [Amphimedon queenslandica]|uniref:DNA topoisomerase n=1 Tax=Amphimedon queenslandica TaxID=400682 RepID=A0AAN0IYF7_AMPQE|nr:PREDICTED: DNA topoisomerase 3-beta-1-like isoform X2 [Amphimedon queenslandica]|eukprot:XP_019849486.1 PREDICTED: DNA topoisomerase 3-beta-1-like isoform X2 [Amphimedon queenslandica]
MRVLMVAEKPSLAKSLSEILSRGSSSRRKSSCSACDVHEFQGKLAVPGGGGPGLAAMFKMTSVCGHVMSLDFQPKYNNWETTDPLLLYDAETMKKEAIPSLRIPSFLRQEGKGVDYLVLWLDCDKEGENICYEVINEVEPVMKPPKTPRTQTIFRAKFSAVTEAAILHAFNNLGFPNWNESRSVDARQELDLRVGCSFTRFQTKLFQSLYSGLNNSVISYGPCQTPTLGFCVERHDEIQHFKPEKYWKLDCSVSHSSSNPLSLQWDKERIFDHEVIKLFHLMLTHHKIASVESVSEKSRSKAPPLPLHTVEMLRACSSRLHISPKQAMDIAERLYTEGYISYPRTETTKYPAGFDFKSIVSDLNKNEHFKEFTSQLLTGGIRPPSVGKDVGDHPPITPLRNAPREAVSDTQWKVYEMITCHFLATLFPDCKYKQTDVVFSLGGESFSWAGHTLIDPGFTLINTWQAIGSVPQTTAQFCKGQKWDIVQLGVSEHMTTPPGYLTESELISLMEKHAIGTDASIPVHIENICTRNYVLIQSGRRLVPTQLGIVLVHGYQKIDPELVKPTMRSEIEKQLNEIALGKADYDQVLSHTLDIFRRKFSYFRDNVSGMNELFEATFSSVASTAKLLSRCGKCLRYMTYIPVKPQRLHCKHCDETYSLPQNGSIKLYKEIKCPLDGFEIVIFSGPRGKTYTVCPYCYSNPPFSTVSKGMSCSTCPHQSCPQAMNQLSIDHCPSCDNGTLLLDPSSGPKWKMYCNSLALFYL